MNRNYICPHISIQCAWLLALAVVSACASPAASGNTVAAGTREMEVTVAAGEFLPGAPRVPFVLYLGSKPVADAQAVKVYAYDLNSSDDAQAPKWSGEAVSYSDYEIPYWVVYPQLKSAGPWGLVFQITQADGKNAIGQFSVEVTPRVESPNVGETPPASHNRTLATEPDLHKLSSATDALPALYQMTVAEAIQSGKPSVITFATPGFCTNQLCAPVVKSVETVYRAHPDAANYIHVEVYKSFDPLVYADEMAEWRLKSEPWTFVLDREGKVAARLAGPVSPRELTEALTPLLSP